VTAIRVNRAPVLTLWAAVVAERLGHAPDTALSLASAVAGTAAQAKARRLGLAEQHDHVAREIAPRWTLRLLGREIATVEEGGTLLAAHDGKPSPAEPVRRYVERAFGVQLTEVRAAMTALAARLPPAELNRVGFKLYEAFRPEVPDGVKGWGAKGELRIESIAAALDQLPSTDG
jgi:hypothetical protein